MTACYVRALCLVLVALDNLIEFLKCLLKSMMCVGVLYLGGIIVVTSFAHCEHTSVKSLILERHSSYVNLMVVSK